MNSRSKTLDRSPSDPQPSLLNSPVSVLLPICNEKNNVAQILNEWEAQVLQYLPQGSELIIEDASDDGTDAAIQAWISNHKVYNVRFFHREQRDGYFNAVYRLYTHARSPYVFISDADGQYVPSDFWKIVPYMNDYDMVHGVKALRNDPVYRVWSSGVFNLVSRVLFHHSFHDINSAHRLLKRDVVLQQLPQIRHMRVLLNAELFLRLYAGGFKIKEVDIRHRPRMEGKSKGLPASTYLKESWNAFVGLIKLKRELKKASVAPHPLG